MKKTTIKFFIAIFMIAALFSTTVYGDVFKIGIQEGNWKSISDTYVSSEYEAGEAYLELYADGYRMGGWILSFDILLNVEDGGEIYGYIVIEVKELGIKLFYSEKYVNNGLFGTDYIENNLTLTVAGETLLTKMDYAYEPMDSRLNTRYYFVLMKVGDTLYLEFRDEYYNKNSLNSIYTQTEINYDDQPLNLTVGIYKDSGEYTGSITVPFILNVPKDSVSFESLEYSTLDYSANAIFFLSLSFLLGAISFNIISTKFRMLKEEELEKEVKKKKKSKKK